MGLRPDYPLLPQPRREFVFFNVTRPPSGLIESTPSSSTRRSANNRKVHTGADFTIRPELDTLVLQTLQESQQFFQVGDILVAVTDKDFQDVRHSIAAFQGG